MPPAAPPDLSLWRLFLRFLHFGAFAWGGPVAQIGMLRQELVDEERWVEPERFNRVLSVYQAMPGPEAHELCVYFGMAARGRRGGLVAGLGFLLPGALAVLLAAVLYVRFGLDGRLAAALVGIQVAAVALVARAVHRIGGHALHDRWLWLVAMAAVAATAGGMHFAVVLAVGGIAGALTVTRAGRGIAVVVLAALVVAAWMAPTNATEDGGRTERVTTARAAGQARPAEAFATGLTAGSLSFGGAYTSIGFVRDDAVVRSRWLDDSQFLDGVALAGSLPAPLVVFATFIGYLAGGLGGSLAMTAGIFLPAFAITLVGHRALERLVDEPRIHRLLDGVTAAVVGLIVVTAAVLAASAIRHPAAALLLAAAMAVLLRWRSRLAIVAVVAGCGTAALLADLLAT